MSDLTEMQAVVDEAVRWLRRFRFSRHEFRYQLPHDGCVTGAGRGRVSAMGDAVGATADAVDEMESIARKMVEARRTARC